MGVGAPSSFPPISLIDVASATVESSYPVTAAQPEVTFDSDEVVQVFHFGWGSVEAPMLTVDPATGAVQAESSGVQPEGHVHMTPDCNALYWVTYSGSDDEIQRIDIPTGMAEGFHNLSPEQPGDPGARRARALTPSVSFFLCGVDLA